MSGLWKVRPRHSRPDPHFNWRHILDGARHDDERRRDAYLVRYGGWRGIRGGHRRFWPGAAGHRASGQPCRSPDGRHLDGNGEPASARGSSGARTGLLQPGWPFLGVCQVMQRGSQGAVFNIQYMGVWEPDDERPAHVTAIRVRSDVDSRLTSMTRSMAIPKRAKTARSSSMMARA